MGTRYEVRNFEPADLDAAAGLRAADHARHRAEMAALDPVYESEHAIAEQIRSILDSGGAGVFVVRGEAEADFGDARFTEFVAKHEGHIVGITVACAISESPGNTPLMRPPNAGLLGHAAVDPDARGLGVGRALGERVLVWSRDFGHDWIGADWRSTNLEADRTWRALGFRPTFYRLFRMID